MVDVGVGRDADGGACRSAGIASFHGAVRAGAGAETSGGFACNAGEAACTRDNPGAMTRVPVSEADIALRDQVLRDAVLAKWGAQCDAEIVATWNETVGAVVDVTIE